MSFPEFSRFLQTIARDADLSIMYQEDHDEEANEPVVRALAVRDDAVLGESSPIPQLHLTDDAADEIGREALIAAGMTDDVLQHRIIQRGPLAFNELPLDLQDDFDLLENLEARYGGALTNYQFRLIEIDLSKLSGYTEHVREHGVSWYTSFTHDSEDGDHRRKLVEGYANAFRECDAVLPIVVDLRNIPDSIDVLDGYHRIAGAALAGQQRILAYDLLPEE